MALLLNKQNVQDLLTMPECIDIVENAFRQLALGTVIMPQRTAIRIPQYRGLQLGMPSYIGGEMDTLALKVVTVYPDNPSQHNLPTTIGVLLLNDAGTGAPLAIMDAGFMTAMRTGAVSGVATKHLALPEAKRVGVFGAGVMAQTQLEAVCAVRAIEEALVFDAFPEKAQAYAERMSAKLGVPVKSVNTARAAIAGMDIVIAASSATQPIFDGAWLEAGQHINAIGSHAPGARELDTAAIVRSKIVPDLLDACLVEAGDIMIPISEGAITKEQIHASLGEIVAGMKPGRESADEITLFKSVGLAIQDAATARFVYQKALETNTGISFQF
jgi:alanine dehydrogenase